MVSPRSGLTASASKPYEEEVPVRPMVRPQPGQTTVLVFPRTWSDHGPGQTISSSGVPKKRPGQTIGLVRQTTFFSKEEGV